MSLMATQPVQSLLAPSRRAVLHRRVRWLVAATIAYNLGEAAVAISAGAIASSTALLGFGLDSLIEVSSAAAVAWQFARPDPQRRERTCCRTPAATPHTEADTCECGPGCGVSFRTGSSGPRPAGPG